MLTFLFRFTDALRNSLFTMNIQIALLACSDNRLAEETLPNAGPLIIAQLTPPPISLPDHACLFRLGRRVGRVSLMSNAIRNMSGLGVSPRPLPRPLISGIKKNVTSRAGESVCAFATRTRTIIPFRVRSF